ncbi:hypothetical protein BZG36_04158, partial [Bifiguratus adelaidae]
MRMHLFNATVISLAALAIATPVRRNSNWSNWSNWGNAPKAVYFITDENKQDNQVVALKADSSTGKVEYAAKYPTGGLGLAGSTSMGVAAPDPTFGQGAIQVSGNYLFAVNPGSNTLSFFLIDPFEPTKLTLVGKPADTRGEFPLSVAYSHKLNIVNPRTGLSYVGGYERPFGLNQTTPPMGPPGTVSDVFFAKDSSAVLVTAKGNGKAGSTGSVWAYGISEENGHPTIKRDAVVSYPKGTALLFGSVVISEDEIVSTDPAYGAAILSYNRETYIASTKSLVKVRKQGAICWNAYSRKTGNVYTLDPATGTVTELSTNGNILRSLSYNTTAAGILDGKVGGDYLYIVDPFKATGVTQIVVIDVSSEELQNVQIYTVPQASGAGIFSTGLAVFPAHAVVIGSGQGGTPLATALAKAGRKTALIEHIHVGGTCINEGCTPTKTMVASARVAYLAKRSGDYGVIADVKPKIDMTIVQKRRRGIVESFRGGSEGRLKSTDGLDLLMGRATFTGKKELRVAMNDGSTLDVDAESIFINVGARPSMPKLEGIENVEVLNSTTIMELEEVPEHLLVIGGGYVGLEFAQMFHRYGSKVTVIQRNAHLLGREDNDIADAVANILREDGINICLNTTPVKVEKAADGTIHLTVQGEHEQVLTGSHLLAAAGRTSNANTLNLEFIGVALDQHGFIKVNDRLETNIAGIYAMGDVKGGPQFTHISYDDFRILKTNIMEKGAATIKDRMVPYTVFMDPQLGRVGMSESEARKQGRNIHVASMPMSWVARALEVDESRGLMKVIVDADNGRILGCAVLGLEGVDGSLNTIAELNWARSRNVRASIFSKFGIEDGPPLGSTITVPQLSDRSYTENECEIAAQLGERT